MLKKILKTILFLFILLSATITYSYIEPYWLKTKEIDIHSKDIPSSFVGKKIVFVTDIHFGTLLSIERVRKIINRINKLNPDIIIMGGDYISGDSKYIKPLFDELKKLVPKHGIYAVLGNHDHWEDSELTKQLMTRNRINICDNKSYWINIKNDSIKIGGVGDLWNDKQLLDSTTFDIKESDFSILISHNPDYIEQIPDNIIDLTLCGHTHGGQITLFGLWAPVIPSRYGQKYRYGLKYFKNTTAYISSGIGTINPPVRLFCRPEIVVINLNN